MSWKLLQNFRTPPVCPFSPSVERLLTSCAAGGGWATGRRWLALPTLARAPDLEKVLNQIQERLNLSFWHHLLSLCLWLNLDFGVRCTFCMNIPSLPSQGLFHYTNQCISWPAFLVPNTYVHYRGLQVILVCCDPVPDLGWASVRSCSRSLTFPLFPVQIYVGVQPISSRKLSS